MTQQDVAAAVGRLVEARQAATDHGMRNVIMSTADCDLILSALQQRSGDERERVARIVSRAITEYEDDPTPSCADAKRNAVEKAADAILGGQSCP